MSLSNMPRIDHTTLRLFTCPRRPSRPGSARADRPPLRTPDRRSRTDDARHQQDRRHLSAATTPARARGILLAASASAGTHASCAPCTSSRARSGTSIATKNSTASRGTSSSSSRWPRRTTVARRLVTNPRDRASRATHVVARPIPHLVRRRRLQPLQVLPLGSLLHFYL